VRVNILPADAGLCNYESNQQDATIRLLYYS